MEGFSMFEKDQNTLNCGAVSLKTVIYNEDGSGGTYCTSRKNSQEQSVRSSMNMP